MLVEVAAPTIKPCVPEELNPKLNITLITDARELAKLEKYFQSVPVFGLDIETNVVTDFTERRIRTIQIGDKDSQYVIDLLPFAQKAGVSLQSQGPSNPAHETLGEPHPCFQPVIDVLKPVLESKRWLKVGHRLQFEYETFKWCFGLCPWNFHDTYLAELIRWAGLHSVFDRNYWSLKALVARYCHMEISKEFQTMFDLESPLTDGHITYGALDTRFPMAIRVAQLKKLTEKGLVQAAQIEFDAIPAFGDMHLNGMALNIPEWNKLSTAQDAICKRALTVMDRYTVPIFGKKNDDSLERELATLEAQWREDTLLRKADNKAYQKQLKSLNSKIKKREDKLAKCEGEAFFNYNSHIQIAGVLSKLGFKFKSTDDSILKRHKQEHPFIEALLEYRPAERARSTYGEEFLRHINATTKRIHSVLNQIGTTTGRTSSRDPNLQNIKRDSVYRSCFIARPGYKLITADYNGAELRIATEYSREPAWLQAFTSGWDVHSLGAEIVFGDEWKAAAELGCAYYATKQKCKCKEHEKLRAQVKAVNFGILYGIGPEKLASELNITEREASELLQRYRGKFVVLISFLTDSGKKAATTFQARSLSGRARYFNVPTKQDALARAQEKYKDKVNGRQVASELKSMFSAIEREGRNMGIQGTNADMIKLAMGCGNNMLWHKLEPYFGARLLMCVHDELVVECPEEHVLECRDFIHDCMIRGGQEFVKSIPTVVESKIADVWSK